MGEMIDLVAALRLENPTARTVDLQVYADALRTYREAADNVRKNGAVVLHPRTGAPLENPYLKIQASTGAVLAKMRAIRSDRVLALMAKAGA